MKKYPYIAAPAAVLVLLLCSAAPALGDATVDGFYPAELVKDGHFDKGQPVTPDASSGTVNYVPKGYREPAAPVSGTNLSHPKLYEGKFIKTTRGVEAADIPDSGQGQPGLLLMPK